MARKATKVRNKAWFGLHASLRQLVHDWTVQREAILSINADDGEALLRDSCLLSVLLAFFFGAGVLHSQLIMVKDYSSGGCFQSRGLSLGCHEIIRGLTVTCCKIDFVALREFIIVLGFMLWGNLRCNQDGLRSYVPVYSNLDGR